MVAEKIFIQGNIYSGKQKTIFSVCRYGNVLGSRGSVVPLFLKQMKKGTLTITHKDMTRFWITLPQATEFVEDCLANMHGGEIFIPKLPSVRIYELAKAISPNAIITYSGIRAGEKIHEELIAEEESLYSKELKEHYIILPPKPYWSKIQFKDYQTTSQKPFCYRSDNNSIWLSQQQIKTAVSGMELQSN